MNVVVIFVKLKYNRNNDIIRKGDDMIYLDYSATTPVAKEVLDHYYDISENYFANPNSNYKIAKKSLEIIDQSTLNIAKLLRIKPTEIIYTSGASESNNTILKGVCSLDLKKKHIITSELEHSSIYGALNYLSDLGYEIDFVKTNDRGLIDLGHLKSLLRKDTLIVSIAMVNSELGIVQPIREISKIVHANNSFFHSDITQAITKLEISFDCLDFASLSAHKFYGMKGIGLIYKKEGLNLIPLIHGGKSTTIYRSGTPATPLIASLAKALSLAMTNINQNYQDVALKNHYLVKQIKDLPYICINSNEHSLPHILNISILNKEAKESQKIFDDNDIYISTQSACSISSVSKAVLALTKDINKAKKSIRISLSNKTTYAELDQVIKVIKEQLV